MTKILVFALLSLIIFVDSKTVQIEKFEGKFESFKTKNSEFPLKSLKLTYREVLSYNFESKSFNFISKTSNFISKTSNFTSKINVNSHSDVTGSSCSVKVFTVKFTSFQPVFIQPGTSEFYYPNKNSAFELDREDQIELHCSSGFVNIPSVKTITISCDHQDFFTSAYGTNRIGHYGCKDWPMAVSREDGSCFNNQGTSISVGFNVEGRWLHLYSSCHNKALCNNFFVAHKLIATPNQPGVDSTDFSRIGGFPVCDCRSKYSKFNQSETVKEILKSETQANRYVQVDTERFLARGHLFAKTDAIYATQQRATFKVKNYYFLTYF